MEVAVLGNVLAQGHHLLGLGASIWSPVLSLSLSLKKICTLDIYRRLEEG